MRQNGNTTGKTSHTQREKFLRAIAEGGTVGEAVKAAGVSRATVYRWRNGDPGFCHAWQDAWEDYVDSLEAMARKRVSAISNTMLLRLLSAYRPQVFGDGRARGEAKATLPALEETLDQTRERVLRELERERVELEARAQTGDESAKVDLMIKGYGGSLGSLAEKP